MRVLRKIHHALGIQFACEVQPVQVPLGAAIAHLAPPIFIGRVHETDEPLDYFALELARVQIINAGVEGVADVVEREGQEAKQFTIIEIVRAGIPGKGRRLLLDIEPGPIVTG